MRITRNEGRLKSTWYSKPTDNGLTMNFHAVAPTKYKRSVVSGLVHRIYRACSSWENFNSSLERGKQILEKNQYPPSFYNPIIKGTLEKIVLEQQQTEDEKQPTEEEEKEKKPEKLLFVQFRGRVTEKFERSLKRMDAPCKVISTIKKLKTVLPSLKSPIEKTMKSRVVYQINCSRCGACYVGQTGRHLITRMKEHKRSGPVGNHLKDCNVELTMDIVDIPGVPKKT